MFCNHIKILRDGGKNVDSTRGVRVNINLHNNNQKKTLHEMVLNTLCNDTQTHDSIYRIGI